MGHKHNEINTNQNDESIEEIEEEAEDLADENGFINLNRNLNDSSIAYKPRKNEVNQNEKSIYINGNFGVSDDEIKGDVFNLIQNKFLSYIRDKLYDSGSNIQPIIANDKYAKAYKENYIDDLKAEIYSLKQNQNSRLSEIQTKEDLLEQNETEYIQMVGSYRPRRFHIGYAKEHFDDFVKTSVKQELTSESSLIISKDVVIATFHKYFDPIKSICDRPLEELDNRATNKRSDSLTYLENDIYNRLNNFSDKDKDMFRKAKVKDKNIVKEFAVSLTDYDVNSMLTCSIDNILGGTPYNFETYTKQYTNDLMDITKPNVRVQTVEKKELLDAIKALKGVDDIVSAKPWYKKIFNKTHKNQRKYIDNAKQMLIDRGIDKKALEAYLESDNNEILLNNVWTKSKDKVKEFNKAIMAKDAYIKEQNKEEGELGPIIEKLKASEKRANKKRERMFSGGVHLEDDLKFNENDVEKVETSELDFNEMLEKDCDIEKDFNKENLKNMEGKENELDDSEIEIDDSMII